MREGRSSALLAQSLFGVAVGLLVLMATWWFWFLARSVSREDLLWHDKVALEMELAAEQAAALPRPGPVPFDERLLVAPAEGLGTRIPGSALEVRLAPGVMEEHVGAVRRRKAMIYGEGAFLLLLIATCVVMLYRLVLAEQRYRRDIDSFFSRVTHEMKTPLAGLKALLQTMRAGRVPDERLRELAELGLRQAEREEHLIENLLLAHRLATTRDKLVTAEIDVAKLLGDFAAHRTASMGESEGRLEITAAPGLVAQAHAGALGTILDNLADNAFKYGARALRIEARREPPGRVAIVVADDGIGFEPGHAEALFEPYQREASGTAGRHGTGLGLPISRELARELGGELSADSDGPGLGSRFTLLLPAGPAHAGTRAEGHA